MQTTCEPNARKLIPLAAHFPGSDTTLWIDLACGSMTEFESFERFARTVERRFDYTLREYPGLQWPRAEAPSISLPLSRIEA